MNAGIKREESGDWTYVAGLSLRLITWGGFRFEGAEETGVDEGRGEETGEGKFFSSTTYLQASGM